jgi:flagellar motor component MotA
MQETPAQHALGFIGAIVSLVTTIGNVLIRGDALLHSIASLIAIIAGVYSIYKLSRNRD